MAGFRIDTAKNPAEEIERVLVDVLCSAARVTEQGDAQVAVHRLRTATKKARALLWLGSAVGRRRTRRLARHVRDVARSVS